MAYGKGLSLVQSGALERTVRARTEACGRGPGQATILQLPWHIKSDEFTGQLRIICSQDEAQRNFVSQLMSSFRWHKVGPVWENLNFY